MMISGRIRQNVPKRVLAACRNISSRLDALDHEEKLEGCLSSLPPEAKVVICGGGVMGAAVAYHLARRGWGGNTILVEKERIGAGSRWHSSGLVGAFKPSLAQVHLAQSSIRLLKELESRGRPTGWKQCGSLLLARTRDRMTLITPRRCQELSPMLNVDDVVGGLWIPGDGVGDPHLFGMSLMREAVEQGVGVMEDCAVTAVLSRDEKVCGVETTRGAIDCQYFVNCAGFWARQVGQLARPQVKVPLLPCEHYYLHTKTIEGLDPMTPVIRDPDGYIYLRERDGSILADWDHFHVLLQELLKRVPSLSQAVLHKLCNGLEAFSPDCKWIVGEAPEMMNYHVAAGMKTVGISAAGGVAEATADEIIDGYSKYDMCPLRHAVPVSGVRDWPKSSPVSDIPDPSRQRGGVRTKNQDGDPKPRPFRIAYTKTFGKPHWFETVQREYWACRESVGLSDYSSFTKIDLQSQGREVVDLLQYLCSNDVDVPVGSIIHTGMQNERGGYENDCSLARITENHYMMIAPTIQQTRCKTWMKRHLPQNGSVTLSDVTSMYTAICVMGPFTRNLLSELTDTDLSPSNFPFFTFKEIDFALHVYNRLMTEGQKYGISHVGYYASRALRVEKFFAFWGQDLDTMTTPLECGRTWRVKFQKEIPFIGRDALLRQREEGIRRQYVQLLLTDHDHELDLWSWGGEPIYRDGNYCGQTTTTSYGYTFKKQVCLGFVENLNEEGVPQKITNDFVLSGHYEIDIAGISYFETNITKIKIYLLCSFKKPNKSFL
ncbi:Uncharacterized protein OBRU01_04874 [Operophtera brumata]|uniref:Pyruvate dehydrogenase phosphatase regulatory subunit, mitochondrial n=1 Tax=Operophtera brumata TaxID=104452 RepID=A0A0L7LNL4_OPEBR|nr:Uncharacterized protein OBRU01_04874 [Operophtera brumata]